MRFRIAYCDRGFGSEGVERHEIPAVGRLHARITHTLPGMGYRGRADWHDMSDYVVHFTKPIPLAEIGPPPAPENPGTLSRQELTSSLTHLGKQDRSGYSQWIQILGSRELKVGKKPLGAARRVRGLGDSQRVVCFSEIPLDMLDRLLARRSVYGLGFSKDFIVAKGGAPLWYLDKEGEQPSIISAQIDERTADGVDPDDPFWRLTPFIDNPGNYAGREYRFEWEREWRVIGDVSFHQDDIAFLFLPEGDHVKARQWFSDVRIENSGPAYFCPYIDPRWGMDRIQDALENVPTEPRPLAGAAPWDPDHSPDRF